MLRYFTFEQSVGLTEETDQYLPSLWLKTKSTKNKITKPKHTKTIKPT